MRSQPLIAVADVEASSRWYQAVLGCKSAHGGAEYEQLVSGGELVLQLHRWDAHEHPHIGSPDVTPRGNGTVLWFQTDEFEDVVEHIRSLGASILEEPKLNPNSQQMEIWLRDPDGYVVVLAGRQASRRAGFTASNVAR